MRPIAILAHLAFLACTSTNARLAAERPSTSTPGGEGSTAAGADPLERRVRQIAESVRGTAAIAIVHVESGRSVNVNERVPMPMFSVYKLPIAIAVLKEVEAGRLKLDQVVRVEAADVAPGAQHNTALWQGAPVSTTIRTLIEHAIKSSDNTASDKLLALAGGPERVTRRLRTLGVDDVNVTHAVHSFLRPDVDVLAVNSGTAGALAALLARLQKGELVSAESRTLLLDLMTTSPVGARRLRGSLPAGTAVADKTGTASGGRATNDVGLITLPADAGHVAVAVLIARSPLPQEEQERTIAEIGRAAYEAFVAK